MGPPEQEFQDEVIGGQFVFEIAQVVAARWMKWWIDGSLDIDDGVGIKVEDAFFHMMEGLVEAETSMTGGEGRHEDVEIDGGLTIVGDLTIVYLDSVFG